MTNSTDFDGEAYIPKTNEDANRLISEAIDDFQRKKDKKMKLEKAMAMTKETLDVSRNSLNAVQGLLRHDPHDKKSQDREASYQEAVDYYTYILESLVYEKALRDRS